MLCCLLCLETPVTRSRCQRGQDRVPSGSPEAGKSVSRPEDAAFRSVQRTPCHWLGRATGCLLRSLMRRLVATRKRSDLSALCWFRRVTSCPRRELLRRCPCRVPCPIQLHVLPRYEPASTLCFSRSTTHIVNTNIPGPPLEACHLAYVITAIDSRNSILPLINSPPPMRSLSITRSWDVFHLLEAIP